jgi:hypothetical protein
LVHSTANSRGYFDLGYVPAMSRYMQSRPAGTKVFTDESMRAFCHLVDASAAHRIHWIYEHEIMQRTPELEAEAARADEFWYARKLVWLTTRKRLEEMAKGKDVTPPVFASYFDTPEKDWTLEKVLLKDGDTPDFVFYRRRQPTDPPPLVLTPASPELAGLFPALPAEWPGGPRDEYANTKWSVPASLRGQNARVEMEAASQTTEPLHIQLRFMHGDQLEAIYALRPYLENQPAKEFFACYIPATSDRCEIQLKRLPHAKLINFTGFRAIVEQAGKPGH